MWMRIISIFLILGLLIVALLHLDLVHSDPGIPIEDVPFMMGAMAFISYLLLQGKRPIANVAVPIGFFLCLAIASWLWVRGQYQQALRLRVEGASIVFPGLYFPKNSLHYTFTAIVESDRSQSEVEREIVDFLTKRGVPISHLRLHFFHASSKTASSPQSILRVMLPRELRSDQQ